MSTHSYLSKCLHRRLHHLGQCCHRMSNAQGEQYHRRHRGHHPGADESPSHKIRSSSCHLPEVSSIGGGRGKYQEGSKASTYQLPSRQARCNHTRFDNHWSFPGSFVDRGRSRKVQGRFKKASTHNLPSHQARFHHVRFDHHHGHLPEVSSIGGVRGKYQEGSKASTYLLPSHQARCNHARFDHHWSFPGSFIDRGRSRKVRGRFRKPSAHNSSLI